MKDKPIWKIMIITSLPLFVITIVLVFFWMPSSQLAPSLPLENPNLEGLVRLEIDEILSDAMQISVHNNSSYRLINFDFSWHYLDGESWRVYRMSSRFTDP